MNRRDHLSALLRFVSIGFVTGCGGSDADTQDLELVHVPIDRLGSVAASTYVIRTPAQWTSFWNSHPHPIGGPAEAPAIDFSRFAVAGVFAGPKGRCQSLQIHQGTITHAVAVLSYRSVTFGAGTPSSCIGNDPFIPNLADMVLLPAATTDVRFVLDA